MTDQQHERCECGWPAYHDGDDTGIYCEKCLWRAPSWEQWDQVMRAERLRKCDGDHGAPQCDDKECWLKEAPDA